MKPAFLKRKWFRAVVLLVIGFVINLGVAWGASWVNLLLPVAPLKTKSWPEWVPASWPTWASLRGNSDFEAHADRLSYFAVGADMWDAWSDKSNDVYLAARFEAGFPLKAFAMETATSHAGPAGPVMWCGPSWPRSGLLGRRLESWWFPIWPVLPGFLVNTLFYAGLVWGVRALVIGVRRRLRRKPGHCHSCGYDLVGLAVGAACPECGSDSGAS